MLNENDFQAVLDNFSYDFDANAFEAVQKDYIKNISKRLSQMLLVCYGLLNSQNTSIKNSEKSWLLVHLGGS